jgi:hypothetical protein
MDRISSVYDDDDDVNSMGENICTINKTTQAMMEACKK